MLLDRVPETAKQIDDSTDFVDVDGSIYSQEKHLDRKNYGKWFKKSKHRIHGYEYCAIYRISHRKTVSMRVHKLVAKAFCPNDCPEIKNIVGHRNNIKHDNRAANLYWTTTSENTKKAFDDGLAKNDKSWSDSQSIPVEQYSSLTNEKLGTFGSICEAARATGICVSTIARQCKYKRPVFSRTKTYFRFLGDETTINRSVIIGYDFDTDQEVGRYLNLQDAERCTGICAKDIQHHVKLNRKPKWTKYGIYFVQRNI